jgi:hypothetical protein
MKSFLFFIIIISSLSSFSQNRLTAKTATCIAFWNNGENKVFQITHTKEKYFKGSPKSKAEVKYEVHLKITDSTSEGFVIEWTYKNFKSAEVEDSLTGSMNEIMEGLTIKYKIDDVGAFSELLNWEEVRDYAFKSIDKIAKAKPNGITFNNALKQTKNMFQSRENIEAVLIKEIQLLHTPYGVEYNLKGDIIETELPNISGGKPFPAKITIKLNEINIKENYCKVSLIQIIDKGKAGAIIIDFIKKMTLADSQKNMMKNKRIEQMEISDVNEFTYSISSGWIVKLLYQRTADILDTKQIEKYQFVEIKIKKSLQNQRQGL